MAATPSGGTGQLHGVSPRRHDAPDHDEAGRDDSHDWLEGMIIGVQTRERIFRDGTRACDCQARARACTACLDGGAHAGGDIVDLAFLEGTWETGASSRLQGLASRVQGKARAGVRSIKATGSVLTAKGMLATWSRPYRKLHTSRRGGHEPLHGEASDDEDHPCDDRGPTAHNAGEPSGHREDGAGAKQDVGGGGTAQLVSTTLTVKGICCPAGGCIQGVRARE